MAAEQRKALEQLMGEQLMNASSFRKQLSIDDPKVCRSFLCGHCPHELFTNTKGDIGPCSKQHVVTLKEEYEKASQEQKRQWNFDYDYFRDINWHVLTCDNKINGAQGRLEKTDAEVQQTNLILKQIGELTRTINDGNLEVETLGELGSVNLAVQEHHKLRVAKQKKDELEKELRNMSETSGPSGHQKLQVCDVCGAYLSRLDNDRRLADHFYGKMHLGFAQMRKEWERLRKELKISYSLSDYRNNRDFGDDRGNDRGWNDRGRGRGGFRGGRGGRGGGNYGRGHY